MKLVRLDQQFHKRVTAKFFDVTVWVIGRGDRSDSKWNARRKEVVKCSSCGALTGGIAIEAEYDVIGITAQNSSMCGGKGGPLRRDDVVDTSRGAGNQIELPFTDNGKAQIENGALRLVQAE